MIEGLAREQFLILPHPEVAEYFQRKAADYDRWLRGMRKLQANTGVNKAMPITLTAEQSRRIGVTYAMVSLGPVRREIRTVGLVTFDDHVQS